VAARRLFGRESNSIPAAGRVKSVLRAGVE
jgi:hypothetical protein